MQDTEAQELLLEILKQVYEQKFTEFHLITSWAEFRFYRRNYLSTRLIIKTLEASAEPLFKSYCKEVAVGSADVNKLLAFSQLREVISFYKKDLAIIRHMLEEYDDYLGHGHFWYSFLGGERDV